METKRGRCHCGAVEFEVDLADGLDSFLKDPRRCNCSLCRRKGAVMAGLPRGALRVTKGRDKLTLYRWNTRIAEHYFCSVCGIYTHHRRRMNPDECGVNVACLEGVDPYALGEIRIVDGAALSVETGS